MFITIPLILIAISLFAIAVIVYGKISYLRKLSPESHEVGGNIIHDFFPELIAWLEQIPWHKYRQMSLRELEKGLRWMRLTFSKIDHASARLIQKIRRTHIATELEHTALKPEIPTDVLIPDNMEVVATPAEEDLKGQEQQLIIEIAQDPKNVELYEKLGDLYLKMDNAQDARESFEAGLGFDPDNKELARKYSELLNKLEVKH